MTFGNRDPDGMRRSLPNKRFDEEIRFFLVALTGLGIDVGVAWALIRLAGASDPVGAVLGFSVATVINYFGHQFWTFREGERRVSLRRFLGFAGAVVLTLIVRLVILDRLGTLLPGRGLDVPLRLGLAAIASFLVSFLLSKFLIFRRKAEWRA